MFIGHLAVGFAAKRFVPRVSLAMLLLATLWADALWPAFLALGIEQVRIDPGNTRFAPLDFVSYPWSHSLLLMIGWGMLIGVSYRGIAGGRRTVWVLGTLVVSHWVLDYVTHRPDMPLYPGGPKFGLGLWNHVGSTVALETAMYVAGLWIYLRSTRARDGVGRWALVALAAILMVAYTGSVLGGPPPSVQAIWLVGLLGVAVLTLLSWWADRHRDPRPALEGR